MTNFTYPQGVMLAMDTSTSSMTSAIFRDGRLLAENNSKAERNHSMYLIPHIQEMLRSLELRPGDIAAIATGVGPGSYTGIRIGVTVAKTFAWARKVPLIGVSSLEAMALGGLRLAQSAAPEGKIWVVPLMDARRGQAFTALYEADGEGLRPLRPDGIRLVAAWTEELAGLTKEQGPAHIIFAGEIELHMDALNRFAEHHPAAVIKPHALRACDVGELAYPRWHAGQFEDVHGFAPNYTQLPEAEVKLIARQKQDE
ncbi:tRNA (adenosine(37)-N6)-threonylcarbamoyltransferase complex dimerization subunit type 1 TsaB [Paenibacillus hamazuiensis]|uniref:tRNA (adenosine(37)-N6)-threonylcarbamoyltransferase complex dimerization subunit type 1 TsaB n=1 Tax=Paenibacillus hamazuiensis TaxID=2936508 RepID=UPI00200E6E54|nr:tRNA (adenosine(37)-N6)-threonylcarbamoyltransferase complex dimerization subunit type 1 TsaB [Paenibacillus hamazuiensis]